METLMTAGHFVVFVMVTAMCVLMVKIYMRFDNMNKRLDEIGNSGKSKGDEKNG